MRGAGRTPSQAHVRALTMQMHSADRVTERLERIVAATSGFAAFRFGNLSIRPQTRVGVDAPVDAAAHARDSGIRLSVDKRFLRMKATARGVTDDVFVQRFRHNHASPFAALMRARFTATRASCTL